jgi:DNA-binding Lrp family transcriptional regulator
VDHQRRSGQRQLPRQNLAAARSCRSLLPPDDLQLPRRNGSSTAAECRVQVRDQVIGVLQANREPDQAQRGPGLGSDGAVNQVQLALDILGFPIQAVIKVRLGSHDRDHVNRLYADLIRVPGVLQALHVAGEDDFHLYVAVESPQALRDLVLEHITVHHVVRQTQTQLVFETRDGVGALARLT